MPAREENSRNNDRIAGYQKAIEESKQGDTHQADLFVSMIAESHQIKNALATEVQALGGEIAAGTTILVLKHVHHPGNVFHAEHSF